MKRLPWKNIYFLFVLSLLAAIAVNYCVNVSEAELTYTNSMFSFLLWAGWLYILRRLTLGSCWERTVGILNSCFAFMLCFTGGMAAGVQLDKIGAVNFCDWRIYAAVLVISTAAAPILGWLVQQLEACSIRLGNTMRCGVEGREHIVNRRKYFLIVWGILFLSYIPTFLASYPGFFTYDAETESYMVFTEKYSAHHPMLHVLALGWIIRIMYALTRSYNAGIALYTLLQMAVLSACFAYMMSFLRSIGVKRFLCNLGIVFLALSPTVSMFVCCSTKDGLFSGGVVLLTTLLLELGRSAEDFWQSKSKKICFVLSLLLILFFRNNGIYALVVFLLFFAVIYRKMWRRWLPLVLASFLVFGITTTACKQVFHFKEGSVAEMLCVPMQQLARVHAQAKYSLSEEDLETLYSLIPEVILDNYNPKLADNVKVNFLADNFKAEPGKYISLWFRTGLKHIDIYVNSFLANTYGYWYPDTVPDGYRGKWITDREYEDSSYFAFVTERPGERVHLLPVLERFYEKISLEIYQQKIPVISMLFSMGFWHWVYAFLAFYLFITGYKRQAFALTVTGLLYLTVLLGPIALVRYVLYVFFMVPLVLALLFDTKTVASKA